MIPTTTQSSSPTTERIFGSSQQVLKETSRLGQLIAFDRVLSKIPYPCTRQAVLKRTVDAWQPVLEVTNDTFESTKRKLLEQVQPERKTMPTSVSQFLTAKITAGNTAAEMHKVAQRVLKDCTSATVSPVKKSHAGLTGPTLLVSYPKTNLQDKFSLVAYVIKWSDREEIAGNLLYRAFSQKFGSDSPLGFSVPKCCGFDFDSNLQVTSDNTLVSLPTDVSKAIKASFQSVAHNLSPDMELHGKQIMAMERIQGENLYDFAKSKYAGLDDAQKKELFYNLGKLVPLDILLGNNDRLLKLDISGDNFLNSFEANLGNVMLSQEQLNGNPRLHAIDNALEGDLSSNKQIQKRYLEIIQTMFKDPNSPQAFAKSMTRSISDALNTQLSEEPLAAAKETQVRLGPLFQDLGTIAQPAFEAGIRDGIALLRKELIPAWDSERSAELKKQLATLHPALLEAVNERLTAFATTKETV